MSLTFDDALHRRVLDYPCIPQDAATGRTADLYADVRDVVGFVPHLFTSLALFPDYLPLAWEQSRAVLTWDGFAVAAAGLADGARGRIPPPSDPRARALLAGRASGRMLLLCEGLRLALADELTAPPAAGRALVPTGHTAFSSGTRPTLAAYGQIRRDLDTPILNELWHLLADEGRLDSTWQEVAPLAPAALVAAPAVAHAAGTLARELPWTTVASPEAMLRAGVTEVLPGIAGVLESFSVTLSRVLVIVASCR